MYADCAGLLAEKLNNFKETLDCRMQWKAKWIFANYTQMAKNKKNTTQPLNNFVYPDRCGLLQAMNACWKKQRCACTKHASAHFVIWKSELALLGENINWRLGLGYVCEAWQNNARINEHIAFDMYRM